MFKSLIVIISLLMSACMMVGPDYKEPRKKINQHWQKQDRTVKEAPFKNTKWWGVFNDKNLTDLINKGYQGNLTVQSAGVRVLQSRAQLAQVVGQLYPQQQQMIGNYNYNRIGGGSLQPVLPTSFDTAMLGFSANWEIDFWGKFRRAIHSRNASFLASYAAYDNALVTLTADIARTYITIRTDESLIKIINENIKVQKLSLKIAQSRFKAGQTSLLDVEQAQTELSETQSTLPAVVSNLQSQKDALAVLMGTVPNEVNGLLEKKRGIPKAPLKVDVGIPVETLVRRPDVHQARLEAIAQSEAIGVAKANLYPALSLSGVFTLSSNNIDGASLGELFNWQNRAIMAGPALNWSLLNYGQITNTVRAQDALFQQTLLNYLNLVLKAQQEVQDNITHYIEAKKAEKFLTTANRSAIKSTHLAIVRYKEGENDYTTVLDAERQQLRVQMSLTNAQGEIPQALVALYRALGGGWQIRNGNDIVPGAIKAEMALRTNWGCLLKQRNHQPPDSEWARMQELYLPNW
jgi:NodT family efflux transporter outer membrane factor (OMF) lipoprotein